MELITFVRLCAFHRYIYIYIYIYNSEFLSFMWLFLILYVELSLKCPPLLCKNRGADNIYKERFLMCGDLFLFNSCLANPVGSIDNKYHLSYFYVWVKIGSGVCYHLISSTLVKCCTRLKVSCNWHQVTYLWKWLKILMNYQDIFNEFMSILALGIHSSHFPLTRVIICDECNFYWFRLISLMFFR